ncbi:hypothetical protein WJX72_004433 [[Myrmecia] bisecta]|uniref:Checkpoint protein n=1 Tax=[Myrmecia] bisecta TaxID=41462 RepID=A0AAW1R6Q3_9CHLO
MKFKAVFSERGLRTLEKGLLPTLEKFGKSCQMLVGPEDLHLIQTGLNTDGMQITARWASDVLFEPDTYRVQSRHNNLIAFSFDLALLSRVLRAAAQNDADMLEMKLAMRSVPVSGGAQPVAKPFLTFVCRGHNLHMVQDLPITKPYPASEIDRLVLEKEVVTLCPYYLDLQGEIMRLQAIVDKLKSISSSMNLVTTKGGSLHIQVEAQGIQLGTEIQGLGVYPAAVAAENTPLATSTPEARLQEALDNGDAFMANIQIKHFAKSLHSSQLTSPAQLLCGIGENQGHVHLMFVYRDPNSEAGFDDNISLSYKLPVRDDS